MARRGTFAALLAKNWVVKTRHPFALLSEVLNPLLCILLFAALKTLEQDLDVPSGWATATANESVAATSSSSSAANQGERWNLFAKTELFAAFNASVSASASAAAANGSAALAMASPLGALSLASGLTVPKFYFTETTMPGLLLNLALQALTEGDRLDELSELDLLACVAQFVLLGYTSTDAASLYTVPPQCHGKVVPYKIAITPDCAYTRQYFAALLEQWHPRLPLVAPVRGISALQLASFRDSRVFFDNESALEAYVASASYGRDLAHPKLYAAIAFHDFPRERARIGDVRGHAIAYALRLNSTYTDRNFPGSVPRTIARHLSVDKRNKELKPLPTLGYTTRGFLTLQTAIARVVNCLPAWDAAAERTNGSCQIAASTMTASDPALDRRLLRQLQDDLVVSSVLAALKQIRDLAVASLDRSDATSSTSPTASLLASLLEPMRNVSISVDAIPAATQARLLQSLRQAPQAFHGASTFVSPIERFHYAGFFDKIAVVLPVGFVLSYLYGVSRVVVALLLEKETRARELMRILGVHEHSILFAWFVTYVQLLLVASVLQTLGAKLLLFPHSDTALLFAFFLSFALASFSYGVLVSSVCSRARVGSFVGMGGFFLMFFVSFAFSESTSEAQRTLACLLSPVALTQGIHVLAQVEAVGVGLTQANARDLVAGFRFDTAIYMQCFDFVLYVLVALYCERVVPREFGVADKWYFCLTPAHWRRVLRWQRRGTDSGAAAPAAAVPVLHSATQVADDNDIGRQGCRDLLARNCEPVTAELRQQESDGRAVMITNLRKEFALANGGSKVAVHGLNLAFYEGQITCLLGHNGAGKSTLLAMLTGMTPPTSGDAWIRGFSVTHDLRRVRESLGFCPQHSVLYPELTVQEHLRFYGRVKGVGGAGSDSGTYAAAAAALAREVDKMIDEVGLAEKRHVRAHALSGGMQRKLSLAIAFVGGSRVVFLDEPTSGMDPYSRRSTWELILNHRRERVLILTTHFMDEADILGDRIAILADGTLQCVGSSLFLKNRFGVGYRLSFVQQQQQTVCDGSASTSEAVTADTLRALIAHHVPQARVDTDVGAELTFLLPFECAPQFPALFEAIETQQQALGVLSFAISVTTLEEIFLRVAEGEYPAAGSAGADPATTDAKIQIQSAGAAVRARSVPVDVAGDTPSRQDESTAAQLQLRVPQPRLRAFAQQIAALLRKRMLSAKRDRNMLFFSCVLPVVIIFIGLSVLKLSLFIRNDPKLELTTDAQYDLGAVTPVPFGCTSLPAAATVIDPWCTALMDPQHFAGGVPYPLRLESVVYASSTPTVFDVTYTAPPIEPNDTTGYCLRFSELVFAKGYGHNNASSSSLSLPPVEGQNGGFLLFGSERDRVLAYSVMVNSSSTHAAPTYKAMIDASMHRFLLATHHQQRQQHGQSSDDDDGGAPLRNATIRVATHPFPLSFTTRSIFNSFLSLPAVLFVVIAFTFVPAAMMPFLIKEKHHDANAKHQQLLSGVSLAAYWLANFVFDMALYVVPMVATILLLRLYGITSSLGSSSSDRASTCTGCTRDVPEAMFTLFVLFGAAIAPWTYVMSHIMKDPGACLLYTIMINFFLGLLLLITSYSLDSLESTQAVNRTLVYIWRGSPLFALGNGLLRVIVADIEALYGLSRTARSAFAAEIAGTEIAYLAIECPLFFVLALAVDWVRSGDVRVCGSNNSSDTVDGSVGAIRPIATWLRALMRRHCGSAKLHAQDAISSADAAIDEHRDDDAVADDEDVAREAQRVRDAPTRDEVVQLRSLCKTYANGKRAVASLSFGLARGECFGFLGINGAGKTTTMKILTGDLLPTSGEARLNGLDIRTQRARVRRCVGYCPQFDALLELLTVREHLEFYGRLKGFDSHALEREVARLLCELQLEPFEHKLAGSLSGGNKRKLSVAIAMLGDPDLLFLDEPSTGMDPHARRFLWDVILRVSVQSKRTTVMLTTHSMDECEALCSKAAIMVGGRLRCFGSIPHLKARYGDGALLECKLHAPSEDTVAALLERVVAIVNGAQSLEQQQQSGTGVAGDSVGVIASAQLPNLCAALGAAERADWIVGESAARHPTGAMLHTQLVRSVSGSSGGGDDSNKSTHVGTLDAREFSSWWLLEDRVAQLTAYLQRHFGAANTVLLERQTDFCRFQLRTSRAAPMAESTSSSTSSTSDGHALAAAHMQPHTSPPDVTETHSLRLSRAFALIEASKSQLGVQEYSISQTSLEQIFNAFARQQQQETRVARGLSSS